MQFLADILAATVDHPICLQTPALDAVYSAGMVIGLTTFAATWHAQTRYEPRMAKPDRDRKYRRWQSAMTHNRLRP